MTNGKAVVRRRAAPGHIIIVALLALLTANAPGRAETLAEFLSKKIEQARRAESHRMYDVALSAYREAIEQGEGAADVTRSALKKRAALYEQLQMFDKAEEDLTRIVDFTPFEPKDLIDRGYFYMRQARYRDALDDFMKGAQYEPRNALYPFGVARALAASREFESAIKFYDEAVKLAPDNAKLFLGRAEAFVNVRKLREALGDYDRAIALGLRNKADRLFGFSGRGYVALLMQDYDGAVRSLDQAISVDPDAANALLWRAHANERRGQVAAALRDYERAAVVQRDSAPARDGVIRLRAQLAPTVSVTR